MEFYQEVERSLIKKYRKVIWSPFTQAVREYQLINPGDKIAVCISGGKDSMLLAKLIQELQRHGPVPFEAVYLSMDPGYANKNRELLISNAEKLHVPMEMFSSQIFDTVVNIEKNPCYLCARMRRGYLYSKARELGCNKIALGHHFNDMIETVVMGMLYGGQIQTMMPKLHSTNFPGMELIRPLYLVREDDIIAWAKHHNLHFLQCACRFTERSAEQEDLSKRREVKRMIAEWMKINPQVEKNIFRSVHRVNLSTILGYKQEEKEYFFLDDYDRKGNKTDIG
ncbi:MAG: tRNA 2-thiocytidine biosynthesis protein TtcA [Oscillospiraceae bacterium]|nr:tRNA 2-thiocytidine biosynthesis protein TtcA [Oscillospiraceae bacterium]